MRLPLLILPLALAGLPSCATAPPLSSLEKQELQSREVEAEKRLAFNACMGVLQDAGYTIHAADFETGLITGNGETNGSTSFLAAIAGVSSSSQTSVSVFLEPWGARKTKVRATFVEGTTSSGRYGVTSTDDQTIYEAEVYRNFFNELDKAIFVRASMRP